MSMYTRSNRLLLLGSFPTARYYLRIAYFHVWGLSKLGPGHKWCHRKFVSINISIPGSMSEFAAEM
jgi:hypothetical protein